MFSFGITTNKYDVDLGELLSRRLLSYPNTFSITPEGAGILVELEGEDGRWIAACALAALLSRDLIYFELAEEANRLPLERYEKQEIMTHVLRNVRDGSGDAALRQVLEAYLAENRDLNLEGFIRFRMQDQKQQWRLMIEQAAEDYLVSREYQELLGVLGAFVEMQPPRMGEIAICLHPDGSCTLTDDSDARIEYVDCSEDGIVGLLVSMAPERLVVYDLSCGNGKHLADTIARVFSGRVQVYR